MILLQDLLLLRAFSSLQMLLMVNHYALMETSLTRHHVKRRYEDGVSDGQMGMTMVVKRHNRRFITKDMGKLINCSPLTVVDTVVVDPIISEAYIQAHRALKGTAKAPLYRILLNEVNYTMDELQSIFIALCFGHEICSSPTSIPCAIYLADECAKRGKNLFQQLNLEHLFVLFSFKFPSFLLIILPTRIYILLYSHKQQ
uniref:Piwi domain-containing protein n=1 Tax=Heterorhabditis bacteriophora TaxID=37862 RepID=A0A1I7WPF2_HETBA